MDERTASEIRGVLSERFPGADIQVRRHDDGAQVVIGLLLHMDSERQMVRFSIDNGPSALLSSLLTGYPT